MNIYVYILMAIYLYMFLDGLAKQKYVETTETLLSFIILLPIYGRVLGWW